MLPGEILAPTLGTQEALEIDEASIAKVLPMGISKVAMAIARDAGDWASNTTDQSQPLTLGSTQIAAE
jgi:hypothetical protein